ncbi:nitrogenase molybdenum-cofactor synthesis protein NifE [Geoalkalibacter ferrihydriticus]|uniref:Nitrogenase iron-molybdenum cofactor biosynthesis protein NifE n=2 Tax=Geoalkalibacter ferrihydriticus TaxID=392333 RepID=A0A0C2HR18_9BACT|nr:nitrogenase iron-molybdenum cofactor biosynthesis protein NifE [Geoalkalibacter ferrihydriticus]KIH77330.1 nitrogenase iron-molybdenum cofactor biosynthesis protein NifE [Geoalkalibacter ferrihydriticus DSM 17813]SDM19621.1 nitrogenase molybdenum-cofactor synthesis protein NifE [Geoalkalibacter ferrihydriticus]
MGKKPKIKELLVESACAHSPTKKSACNTQTPGATTGGCAFEGAQISLFPYADAVHLVHGPITCLGASWETRATPTSYSGRDFTQMGFTTDISTNDVVFGGEDKLRDAIAYIMQHYAPEAILVYATCVTALIGDDIDAVCRQAQNTYGIPMVPVHAPGFVGSKNLGSRLGGEAVLASLVGTREPEKTTPFDINLIGEYNVTGDMWQYTPLLEELGIRVLATLSGDGRIADIRTAHRARLNVIVCAKSLISLTRKMQEQYGIPFISLSFYGKRDTSNGLLALAEALGDKDLCERTRILVTREEAWLDEKLAPYRRLFQGKKAILNTGGNKSWSIASALQDLGVEVVATSVRKATEDDKEKARQYLGENGVLMTNPGTEQAQIIDRTGAHLLLAGGRSLYTAIKKRIAFIDVNQEKKKSYGGYKGLLNLAEDVKNALENPVFTIVAKEAPWEK